MSSYHYRAQLFRISASIIASAFITLHGRWHLIGTALRSPAFYIAFVSSFVIAYLLMFLVQFISVKLDSRLPLQERLFPRILLQLLMGIILPCMLDIMFMAIYFTALGRGFPLDSFMIRDFPFVVLLLLIINSYYLWTGTMRGKSTSEDRPVHILQISYNGNHLKLNAPKDILFFYRDKKLIKVFTISGKIYSLKDSISNLDKKFRIAGFAQVNPSAIVNLNAINGYVAGTSRDTLRLLFKLEYLEALKGEDTQLLRVTKEYIASFKQRVDIS